MKHTSQGKVYVSCLSLIGIVPAPETCPLSPDYLVLVQFFIASCPLSALAQETPLKNPGSCCHCALMVFFRGCVPQCPQQGINF